MQSVAFENRPTDLSKCWAFVRGDLDVSEFENWLYFEESAELALGPDLFLEAVSTDFGNPRRIRDLRNQLSAILPSPAACKCHTIPNRHLVTMGASLADTFDHLEGGTATAFWTHRLQCRVCASEWWVVAEERIYDVWIFFRGWDKPPKVGTYRSLLALAVEMGASVRYADPCESFEIPAAIEDLAKETPGISISELAKLLPVRLDVVWLHASRVAKDTGLKIDLEN